MCGESQYHNAANEGEGGSSEGLLYTRCTMAEPSATPPCYSRSPAWSCGPGAGRCSRHRLGDADEHAARDGEGDCGAEHDEVAPTRDLLEDEDAP